MSGTPSYAERFFAFANLEPAGYRQLSPTVSTGIDIGRVAIIQALDQNCRWRDDGTDPTANTGMRLHAGETLPYTGNMRAFRIIQETAGAEVNIIAYK